jgi:hypothetical protein
MYLDRGWNTKKGKLGVSLKSRSPPNHPSQHSLQSLPRAIAERQRAERARYLSIQMAKALGVTISMGKVGGGSMGE